jgi:flagellar biosynthesis protein FliQ
MTDATVLHLVNQMLLVSLKVCGPILAVALVVGVVISVLQAATQVQEMTLTYVPKMIAVAILIAFLGPWMLHVMINFSGDLIGNLDRYAH